MWIQKRFLNFRDSWSNTLLFRQQLGMRSPTSHTHTPHPFTPFWNGIKYNILLFNRIKFIYLLFCPEEYNKRFTCCYRHINFKAINNKTFSLLLVKLYIFFVNVWRKNIFDIYVTEYGTALTTILPILFLYLNTVTVTAGTFEP